MKVGDKVICLVDCAGEHISMSEGEEYNVTENNIEEMEDAVMCGHAVLKQADPPVIVPTPPKKASKVTKPAPPEEVTPTEDKPA